MKTREELKNYFNAGDRPTEQNFADLITTLATQSGSNIFSADLQTFLGEISCVAVSATSFYGDGSNLTGVQSGLVSGANLIPLDYVVPVMLPSLSAGARLEMNFELGDIGDPESIYWTMIDGITGLPVDQLKHRIDFNFTPVLRAGWLSDIEDPTEVRPRQFVCVVAGSYLPMVLKNNINLYGSAAILRAYGGASGYLQAERFTTRGRTASFGEFYSDGSSDIAFPEATALPITYQSLGIGVIGGFYNGPFGGPNGPFGLSTGGIGTYGNEFIKSQVESFWLDRTVPTNTKLVVAFKSLESDTDPSPKHSGARRISIGVILP